MKEYRIEHKSSGYYEVQVKKYYTTTTVYHFFKPNETETGHYWEDAINAAYVSLAAALESLERLIAPDYYYPPDYKKTSEER